MAAGGVSLSKSAETPWRNQQNDSSLLLAYSFRKTVPGCAASNLYTLHTPRQWSVISSTSLYSASYTT